MSAYLNKEEFRSFVSESESGLYIICAAKRTDNFSKQDRCDAHGWGPCGPLKDGDERKNTVFGSLIVANVSQIEKYRIVYAFPPYGFIIHIQLRHSGAPEDYDLETEYRLLNETVIPCTASSFGDLIKLIIEWSKMKENPWSNRLDPVADICSNFLKITKIPRELVDDIDYKYNDMQVYKFLKGDENARKQNAETNVIDASIIDMICESMPKEHPYKVFTEDELDV